MGRTTQLWAAAALWLVITGCRCQGTPTQGQDGGQVLGDDTAETVTDAAPIEIVGAKDSLNESATPDIGDVAQDAASPDGSPTLACPQTGPGVNVGLVQVPALNEASGLAASHGQAGIFWTHNDSGDDATLFALDSTGKLRGTFSVTGATAIDWEDISLAPKGIEVQGRTPTPTDKVIIADFGDNLGTREAVTLYLVDEPTVGTVDAPATSPTAPATAVSYRYPDGPQDAEGLAVAPAIADVTDGPEVYILTKAWTSGVSTLFRYPPPLRPDETVTVESVGTIALDNLGGGLSFLATGLDISPSGQWLLVRTYENVLAWPRPAGQPIAAALSQSRCTWSQQEEPQGEAITFSADGTAYYTLSERKDQPLWRFDILPAPTTP